VKVGQRRGRLWFDEVFTEMDLSTAVPAKPTAAGSYEVGRPHGKCAVCGQIIEPGEKFMACLRETSVGFERADCMVDCWETFDRQQIVAFWKTTMPRPEAKKKIFVDDQVLCELFERLADVVEPSKLNFRFVLGLILMRKRMLVYESTLREGEREIWSMRFRGRDDRLDLLNPQLTEEQVTDVSRQLGEILNEGL
jgi:hypothetical protein